MATAGSKAAASILGGIAVAVLALAGTTFAQDKPSTNLDQAIATLDAALKNEPGLSESTKQALSQVVGSLKTERAEVATTSKLDKMIEEYSKATSGYGKRKAFESVVNHLKIYGDFRFRLEGDVNRDNQPDRFRPRVRFRLGFDWWLTDELTLNTRFVTGDPFDAQSPHQTLDQTFDKWDSNWDRLFLTYKPKCFENLTLLLGKFENQFYKNPVYGELVVDSDVGWEGLAAKYTIKGGECSILDNFTAVAGIYDFIEANNLDDTFAFTAQVAATIKFSKCWNATGAVGYYLWGGPVEGANAVLTGDNSGNATVDLDGNGIPDNFASDFEIIHPVVSTTFSRWENWPITVAAEYFLNTEAANDRDQGWAVGASVGKTAKDGDWKFYLQYQEVEQDSVFTPVCQDDFILQTNFTGWVGGIWYLLTDDINLHLWSLVAAREDLGTTATTDSDQDQWRFRLDLNIRF